MELRDYFLVLRAHWLVILIATVVGAGLGAAWTFTQPKVYAANSSGIYSMVSNGDVGQSALGDSLSKSKAKTYSSVASSRAVAEIAIEKLGLNTTPEALARSVTVTVPVNTATLEVLANANTPEKARDLADAWIAAVAEQVAVLEGGGTAAAVPTAGTITLVPVESAVLPSSPTSPNMRLAVAIGAIGGLAAGLAYAFVRHYLDRRIRSVEMLQRHFDVTVLGTLPIDKRLTDDVRLLPETAARAGAGSHALPEALRELRTNLQFMSVDEPPRVVVVSSPLPADGKSTVTANLAVTIAASGQKVIVVDGDLRRPSVSKVFGLVPGVGITDLLIGNAELDDVLQPWGVTGNLMVLGAGSIPPNPSELLASEGMHILLRELSRDAFVLVDAPPLLPVTDAAILAARTDGVIVVVSAGKTTTDGLGKALQNVEKTQGKTLGVILNRIPVRGPWGHEYGYYYGYYGKTKGGHASSVVRTGDEDETIDNVVHLRTGTHSS